MPALARSCGLAATVNRTEMTCEILPSKTDGKVLPLKQPIEFKKQLLHQQKPNYVQFLLAVAQGGRAELVEIPLSPSRGFEEDALTTLPRMNVTQHWVVVSRAVGSRWQPPFCGMWCE